MSTAGARRTAACPDCARLAAVVADHARRIEALEARRQKPDVARDARLLAAVAALLGSAVFTAKDLQRASRTDAELAAVLAGVSGRRLGAWLRRLHGTAGTPYQLRRVCRDGAGVLWTLDV